MIDFPLSIDEAAAALRSGALTSVALTQAVIEQADRLDPILGTYLVRFNESALAAASQADEELAAGNDRGLLQGIPIGVKDILAMAEGPTTAQSLVHDPRWGENKDAPVVSRLKRAGAVITGKTTTMEYAIGAPDATKPFPIPLNPWNLERWTGGSSSGTGNGVAAGMMLGGIGTDTGGSIRIPAAFCGISGLMPTFGRVPKSGCVPLAESLDHIGPMARSVRDCAAMLQVMAGYHPSDSYAADVPVPNYLEARPTDLRGMRVGVEWGHLEQAGDPAAARAFEAAIEILKEHGAEIVEITIPFYDEMCAVAMLSIPSEAFAYHRNDLRDRWEEFFASTRGFVTRGALLSGADYVQAQRVRRVAQHALGEIFTRVDVIADIMISVGAPIFSAPGTEIAVDFFDFAPYVRALYWNPTGNPALAIPMGFSAEGLPLSIQFGARAFEESSLLHIGVVYQSATDWHRQVPPLSRSQAVVQSA